MSVRHQSPRCYQHQMQITRSLQQELAPILLIMFLTLGLTGCKTTFLQTSPRLTQINQPTSIPIDMRAGVPIIQVMINGNGPFRFILDTGADVMCINRRTMQRLGLPDSDYQWDQVSSNNGRLDIKRFKHIDTMTIGHATFRNFDVMEINLESDTLDADIPFDGLVNARLFYDMLMTLDYPKNRLILSPYKPLNKNSPDTLKCYLKDSIHLTVDLKVGKQTMPFIVDTGASIAFSFKNHPGEGLNWLIKPRLTEAIETAYGPNSNVYKGRLQDNVIIGQSVILSPEVYNTLSPEFIMAGVDQKKTMIKRRLSLLGSETLKYFIVSFDQRAGYIRFKPPTPSLNTPAAISSPES